MQPLHLAYLQLSHERSQDTAVVSAAGEIDMSSSPDLNMFLRDALMQDGIGDVVVNLQGIDFMDCAAISTFVIARNVAVEQKISFRLQHPSVQALKVIEMTKLHHKIDVELLPTD